MPVSNPWIGYGTPLFLDLGKLTAYTMRDRELEQGEASIQIIGDWRIERQDEIVGGASCTRPKMESQAASLKGLSIASIIVAGAPPELTVTLDNGVRVRSMELTPGDPQWGIRLRDGTYLSCDYGKLISGEGSRPLMTDEEKEVSEWTEATAKRWGKPTVEPASGNCWNCGFCVRIDGDFSLLDYGVCANADGPLDGRVVNVKSGCPVFEAEPE